MKGCYCSITISPVVSGYRATINTVHITSKLKLIFWCALCYLLLTTNKNSWIINNFLYSVYIFNTFKHSYNVNYADPGVPSRGLMCGTATACFMGLWVRIPPGKWMSLSCECCVLWGRGLCVGLITRAEKSYRMWCVLVGSWSLDRKEALAY
jgi:hypothetical protein